MPTRPLIVAAIILALPVALLTVFAVRSLSLENEALNVRHGQLSKHRMETAANVVQSHLQNVGADVLVQAQAAYGSGDGETLSKLARKRIFAFALVLKQGEQVFAASAFEHQFDIVRLLQDKARSLAETLSSSKNVTTALVTAGGSHTLVRCARNAFEYDICVAVAGNEVLEQLGAALELAAQSTALERMSLIGPEGIALNPLGSHIPGAEAYSFTGLLNGWQLRAQEKASEARGLWKIQSLYVVAGAITLGWLAMTWMLYRSSILKDEAATARANVIAQLAHELRTPLANLKLYTDLLQRKTDDEAEVKRYGAVLESEIERLSNLAENAIAVARGAIAPFKRETAVPDDSVRTILDRFEPTLADARCRVSFEPGAGKASSFDRVSWERCIVNLIDNACKYASGSEVLLATQHNSDMLRLEITDRGPGIAPGQEERIFESLQRGATNKASGFGLGLAAVRALTRQNGGDCWAEPSNSGARFVLTMNALPIATESN